MKKQKLITIFNDECTQKNSLHISYHRFAGRTKRDKCLRGVQPPQILAFIIT